MNSGFPSMTALLGLIAVAGYQNRDKIGEWLGAGGQSPSPAPAGTPAGPAPQPGAQGGGQGGGLAGMLEGLGNDLRGAVAQPGAQGSGQGGGQGGGLAGMLEGLGSNLRGATPGGILSGGLGELINRFKQSGQSEAADSWVGHGPNKQIAPADLERAIGSDTLDTLTQHTGLSRQELLERLSRELPGAVDKYTPEGQLPGETDPSNR